MVKILTVECLCRIETCLFEKVVGIANKRITRNNLDQIYHDGDLCSYAVDTLEQIQVARRCFEFLFQKICLLNSKQHLIDIWCIFRRRQLHQRLTGIFFASLADKPIWTFRSKRQADEDN